MKELSRVKYSVVGQYVRCIGCPTHRANTPVDWVFNEVPTSRGVAGIEPAQRHTNVIPRKTPRKQQRGRFHIPVDLSTPLLIKGWILGVSTIPRCRFGATDTGIQSQQVARGSQPLLYVNAVGRISLVFRVADGTGKFGL
jgi:hypothetical protein